MNRHSRVHLAQKRKQMEELSTVENTTNSSVLSSKKPNLINESPITAAAAVINDDSSSSISTSSAQNDKSMSYCKDCDIQFSSIKTYQHHRTNYCQKYKTIESVVPVDVTNANVAATVQINPDLVSAAASKHSQANNRFVKIKTISYIIF